MFQFFVYKSSCKSPRGRAIDSLFPMALSKNPQKDGRPLRICKLVNEKNISGFFFLSAFSFTNIHESQDCRGRGGISLTPHYHLHPLHRHLDISRANTAERSPLHMANSRTQTGNLWFPSASR